jgi:hypothetical protein
MITPPPIPRSRSSKVESVRSGQQLILLAILLNFSIYALRFVENGSVVVIMSGLIGLAAIILSIIGMLRMTSGLGYHIALRIVFCILMIVPLVNLITLLILNSKATATLRRNGYKVGLLGAEKRSISAN